MELQASCFHGSSERRGIAVKNVDCGYFQPCETGLLLGPEDFGHATSRTLWFTVNFPEGVFFLPHMDITTAFKKYCPACRTTKPTTEFYKKADTPDKLQTQRKACQRKLNAKRPGLLSKPKGERGCERYQIVRNASRLTGRCSWGVLDNLQHSNSNPVIHVADNLRGAILEQGKLNAPAKKLRYTKRGQVGFISNDDEEVE